MSPLQNTNPIDKTEVSQLQLNVPLISESMAAVHVSRQGGGGLTDRIEICQPDSQESTINTYKLSPSSSMAQVTMQFDQEGIQRIKSAAANSKMYGAVEPSVQIGNFEHLHQESSRNQSDTLDLHEYAQ